MGSRTRSRAPRGLAVARSRTTPAVDGGRGRRQQRDGRAVEPDRWRGSVWQVAILRAGAFS
jgi:hypothetical protein